MRSGKTVQGLHSDAGRMGSGVRPGSTVRTIAMADWLGSSRLATTPTAPTSVSADSEYAPYGGGLRPVSGLGLEIHRAEIRIRLYKRGIRGYTTSFSVESTAHGSWISPDPAGKGAADELGAPARPGTVCLRAKGPLLNALGSSG